MGNRRINLKAFTISETLISMLISSMIIGVSYFFITSIYDQMNWYSNTSHNTEEFARVSYELNKKLFEANTIESLKNGIRIQSEKDTTLIKRSNPDFTNSDSNGIKYSSIDTIVKNERTYLKIDFLISHNYGKATFPCYFEIFE